MSARIAFLMCSYTVDQRVLAGLASILFMSGAVLADMIERIFEQFWSSISLLGGYTTCFYFQALGLMIKTPGGVALTKIKVVPIRGFLLVA